MKPLSLFWLGLSMVLQAQTSPDPKDLLAHSDSEVFNAQTLHLAGTRSIESASDATTSTTVISFDFQSQNDGKTREEILLGKSGSLTIFDGAKVWRYTAGGKNYTTVAAVRAPATQFGLEDIDYGRGAQNIVSANMDGEEQLVLNGSQTPCDVIAASYRGWAGNPQARKVTRRVWISRGKRLVLRDSWSYEIPTAAGAVKHTNLVNYTTVEWDTPIAADRFRFEPPAGTELASTAGFGGTGNGNAVRAVPVGPTLVSSVPPEYSDEARRAGLQGTVWVFVEVDERGQPSDLEVQYGLGLGLDEKAVEAVKQWRFRPEVINGTARKGGKTVAVDFQLEGARAWRLRLPRYVQLTQYVAPEEGVCPVAGGRGFLDVVFAADGSAQPAKPVEAGNGPGQALSKALSSWRFRVAFPKGKPPVEGSEIYFECGPPGGGAGPLPAGTVRVGPGVSAPKPVYTPEPTYAEEARKTRLQGTVHIDLIVGADGSTQAIHVLRPLGLGLDEKAVETVRKWRFRPGMKDGRPVAIQATVEVSFRLL